MWSFQVKNLQGISFLSISMELRKMKMDYTSFATDN